ncbi:molybdopterin-guanine dinucleotide biosynthesis protein MobB [Trichlorobacter thiogenes]|uniref:Molybdopterin molybdenumtransferase n=1 Tax=Trichlorobacter thiogenes TaxID=115783 RepID=A0A1T4PNE9_9BACT|nr:molybdopterin-guanine dinucleotide biosynthesis protein MobB [Trichlorobacter thiogenes]
MKKPPVVSFVAHSGTGKTTLLEQLIPILKARGYRVGAIKHDAHRFEIDHPGKDSHRLTVAGADSMLICSGEKLALVRQHQQAPTVEELLAICGVDLDIILTEGFKQSSLPKIELHRAALGRELICRGTNHDPALLAVASDVPLVLDVPLLDLNNPAEIAAFIEEYAMQNSLVTELAKKQEGKQPLTSVKQAFSTVLEHGVQAGVCCLPLLDALGRVLAEDQIAQFDIPSCDYSAMDGYGFCHDDVGQGALRAEGFLPAGQAGQETVAPGTAIRIMTGAPIPPGCDTVVPLENLQVLDGLLQFIKPFSVGDNIRRAGEDLQQGQRAVTAGTVLRFQEITLLSAMNLSTVPVYAPLRVAILATGDELLEPGSERRPGMVINSNSNALAAQVREAGAEPLLMGIAEDQPEITRERLRACLSADLVLVTGGASAGDHDYVKPALLELGGSMLFDGVNIKPGKPFGMGLLQGKPVFSLPGNPVAAMVIFELFVRPMLLKGGGRQQVFRPSVQAVLTEPARNKGARPHFVGAVLNSSSDGWEVSITGSQSSGRISSLTLASGLALLAPESSYQPGDAVTVLVLDTTVGMQAVSPWD